MKVSIPSGHHHTSKGFTLIELMVSLALSVVLSGGVIALYIETIRNQNQDDELARLQENARYAIKLLRREITMSGFFAGVNDLSSLSATAVGTDCVMGGANWALDLTVPLELVNDVTAGLALQTISGNTLNCIDTNEVEDGTDIISIKRTSDSATLKSGALQVASEDLNQWYLKIFDYRTYSWSYLTNNIARSERTLNSTYDYWEYYAKIFYIRDYSNIEGDGIPALCEEQLLGSTMAGRCQVEGIEDLQLEFGIDGNGDGVAEQYKSAPLATDFDDAVSVRIYLLVRSINDITGYTNSKSYRLGSKNIPAFNDGFIRKVFTTTIHLRNNITG